MKKSNIILVATEALLLVVLLFLFIYGKRIEEKRNVEPIYVEKPELPDFSVIVVKNNARLDLSSGDSPQLDIYRSDVNQTIDDFCTITNDTLHIFHESVSVRSSGIHYIIVDSEMHIYVNSYDTDTLSLDLRNSYLKLSPGMQDRTHINMLKINLKDKSTIRMNKVTVENLQLAVDDDSFIDTDLAIIKSTSKLDTND